MTAELIAAVKALPLEQQRHVVEELNRHLNFIDSEVAPEFAMELESRFNSIDEHPDELIDWNDIKIQIAERRKSSR